MRHLYNGNPLRPRSGVQKSIDYMLAYRTGPAKIGRFPSHDLHEARERYVEAMVRMDFAALEQAIQGRIDEEGCGAFFAAAIQETQT